MNAVAMPESPFAGEVLQCRAVQVDWARLPVRMRLRMVTQLRRLLVAEADRLCEAVERDVNRPAGEVLITDIVPAAEALKFLERDAERILRPRRVSWTRRPLWLFGQRDTIHRRPHGVVGIIGTWNYPIFLNLAQIAQALAAGNGVLWKPSELMPESAGRLHALFLSAGVPRELLQLLPATREAGPQLAEADVNHVVFTGSAAVGRKLAARLGERLISSTLELSGCDAMFVLADANIEMAAKAAWFGATLNKGQTCLAVRRVFVDRSIYSRFLDALRPLADAGPPMALALQSQVRQAERLVNDARAGGARVVGTALPSFDGARMTPVVLADAAAEMAICREASFAPISAVTPFDSIEQAMEWNQQCQFGLGASIFTADVRNAERLAAQVAAGMVSINDVIAPTGHPATPFGGRGDAGWGVTQGADGLLGMTVPQVVSVRGGSWRPHYRPVAESPALVAFMRGLMEWSHAGWGDCWRGLRRMAGNARRVLRGG